MVQLPEAAVTQVFYQQQVGKFPTSPNFIWHYPLLVATLLEVVYKGMDHLELVNGA